MNSQREVPRAPTSRSLEVCDWIKRNTRNTRRNQDNNDQAARQRLRGEGNQTKPHKRKEKETCPAFRGPPTAGRTKIRPLSPPAGRQFDCASSVLLAPVFGPHACCRGSPRHALLVLRFQVRPAAELRAEKNGDGEKKP